MVKREGNLRQFFLRPFRVVCPGQSKTSPLLRQSLSPSGSGLVTAVPGVLLGKGVSGTSTWLELGASSSKGRRRFVGRRYRSGLRGRGGCVYYLRVSVVRFLLAASYTMLL